MLAVVTGATGRHDVGNVITATASKWNTMFRLNLVCADSAVIAAITSHKAKRFKFISGPRAASGECAGATPVLVSALDCAITLAVFVPPMPTIFGIPFRVGIPMFSDIITVLDAIYPRLFPTIFAISSEIGQLFIAVRVMVG
jgi:hypothetical protein